MAHLGTKPADWDKYVKDNPKSRSIDYEIENNISNVAIYKDKTLTEVVATVSTGDTVKITSNTFIQIKRSKYTNVQFGGKSGVLRITAIRKPTGKGGADAEQRTLDLTKDMLNKLAEIAGIGGGNRAGIDLVIPGIGMKLGITSVEKVPNRIHGREAKSDFVLKNAFNKNVLFISHKDGSGPQAFGQYGGISTVAGNIQDAAMIYNHPEVQQYVTRLHQLYSDATGGNPQIKNNPFNSSGKLMKAVFSYIMDARLVNMSVYGPDFGNQFGPDNVHLIGQGNFVFNPLVNNEGDLYFRLSFSGHQALNGDVKDFMNNSSGYRATLITTFRTGRPTQTPNGPVPETRTAIYPRRYRTNALQINTLK